jgi:hypothetical protein
MMKADGPKFQQTFTLFFQQVWQAEVYPIAWHDMLVQPLYKGGGKQKADPVSYRGICLSPHVIKLFEGLLGHSLTQHTTTHDTLTPYQFGSKPGTQTHDAMYTLLAVIHNN